VISLPAKDYSDVDWDGWNHALEQFASATGVVASAYDASGQRRGGPYMTSRLAGLLASAGTWDDGGAGMRFERGLVERTVTSGVAETALFCKELRVHTEPLVLSGVVHGAIVYGWVFCSFTSGMSCEKIARELNISGGRLWAEARLESPVSDGRMATYTGLLRTLINSTARQTEAIARLNELNRMRDVFLATVSHEMRTPLAAMSLRLELLLQGNLDDPVALRKALTAMTGHVSQETRMVEDLIDAAQTRTGQLTIEPRVVSLRRVLRDALSTIEPKAEVKAIRLDVDALEAGSEIQVWGDAQRLQQLFWNLLSNAVKFTPAGGTIAVEVRPAASGHEIDVRDSGGGIAENFLPHVFGAFNKQELDNQQGLGLGLYIAKHIVDLHGGAIRVNSPGTGLGTIVTVALPALDARRATGLTGAGMLAR
jgi:signal transduction histidine kinase